MDENPVTAATYQVLGMPTLALFIDGQIVVRFVGAKPRSAILALLEPHLGVPPDCPAVAGWVGRLA